MPKEYSTKFKTEVIKRYQNGESILALSQELRIAQSTIYHWRKEFCSIKAANRIYTPKEFDALSRRLEKLEHEMEIIKRSGYIADVPLQKKLSVLENIYRQADNTYSVHELCEALDIARGTFYNYIFRRADHSKREEAQIELMRLVQQVFDDSSQRFGAEKIRVTLAGSQFTADHPNQIWVSDITYFKVNDYWMYLCIILDLFSRRIVDYRVSRNASTNLVTSTFRTAFRERGNPSGLTFHSDRGKQYTSAAFTALLQKCEVKQSFSATARPHDNAVAETFFASFKKEEAYRREYTSEQSYRKSVEQYIRFYNELRPHRTLKYKTPQAFEEAYRERL